MPFGLKNVRATYQWLVNKVFHDQISQNMEVYVDDMLAKSIGFTNHIIDLIKTFNDLWLHNMKLNLLKCGFNISIGKFLRFMVSRCGIEAYPKKIRIPLDMHPPRCKKKVQQLIGQVGALNCFISKVAKHCLSFFKILRKMDNFIWNEDC